MQPTSDESWDPGIDYCGVVTSQRTLLLLLIRRNRVLNAYLKNFQSDAIAQKTMMVRSFYRILSSSTCLHSISPFVSVNLRDCFVLCKLSCFCRGIHF